MKQTLLNLCTLLCLLFVGIGNAWGDEVTLTNANIVAAGNANSGYAIYEITDGNNNTWNAYAIKNYHSNATKSYHYLQIKKYASSTAYYIQIPTLGTKINSITLTVSSSNKAMADGSNTATLYFSSSNSTSATGTGVVSGTGASSITLDASSLNLNTGYITASAAVRIWDITVDYTTSQGTTAASSPSLTTSGIFTTSTYDVTITNNESGATVYYTTDGNDPTTSSNNFTGDSKTITIDATTTIKAMAVISGKDNSPVASATYTYEKSIANTAETAYTTAEAIALIDAGSTQLATTEVYVKGTISKVDSYNSTYGSITYWLDNDAFEIYGGLNLDGAKFTAATDLQTGDEVVVKGLLTKYVNTYVTPNTTTYEMDKNNVLISRTTAATQESPTFTYGTCKKEMTTEDAADTYEITTNSDGALSVKSSDENVATVSISGTTVTVTPKAVGTTTITLSAAETATYYAASKSYTLTITEPVKPAELPFSFDGGVADVATTQGMSQTGLGSDYSASPKLKFDTQSDELVINYNTAGSKLAYTIKVNGDSYNKKDWDGTFDVLESADGNEYTKVKSYTNSDFTYSNYNSEEVDETYELSATSRYVKFIYTTKTSGNVALGAISITAAGAKEDPKLAFEKTAYTFATDDDMAVKATSTAGSTGKISYALTEGDAENFLIDENTGDIVCETEGTYTVTATIAADDNYETATATATVTIEAAKETTPVALVAKYGDKYFAMDHSFGAVEVIIKDNKAYVASSTLKDAITWNMSTTGTETTFQTSDEKYLSAPSKTTLKLVTDAFNWTLDSENNTWSTTVGSTERSFLYREQADAFKAYASNSASTDDYSDMAQAYEIAVIDNNSYVRENLTVGGYGTICLPNAVAEGEHSGATYYSITDVATDGTLALTEQKSLEAGTPYVFQATATTLVCMYSGSEATQPVRNTYLTGCFVDTNISSGYVLQYQDTDNDGEKDTYGFYKVDGTKTVPANRAYFSASVSGIKAFTFGDNTDAISNIEAESAHNDVIYNLAGQRVSKAQKGIYIINGKKILK